ncbi:hypothetical protein K2X83_02795 [Patescibacteria group bacterium]|nr:hypothetical protein [Patescibacteria group bacterium]
MPEEDAQEQGPPESGQPQGGGKPEKPKVKHTVEGEEMPAFLVLAAIFDAFSALPSLAGFVIFLLGLVIVISAPISTAISFIFMSAGWIIGITGTLTFTIIWMTHGVMPWSKTYWSYYLLTFLCKFIPGINIIPAFTMMELKMLAQSRIEDKLQTMTGLAQLAVQGSKLLARRQLRKNIAAGKGTPEQLQLMQKADKSLSRLSRMGRRTITNALQGHSVDYQTPEIASGTRGTQYAVDPQTGMPIDGQLTQSGLLAAQNFDGVAPVPNAVNVNASSRGKNQTTNGVRSGATQPNRSFEPASNPRNAINTIPERRANTPNRTQVGTAGRARDVIPQNTRGQTDRAPIVARQLPAEAGEKSLSGTRAPNQTDRVPQSPVKEKNVPDRKPTTTPTEPKTTSGKDGTTAGSAQPNTNATPQSASNPQASATTGTRDAVNDNQGPSETREESVAGTSAVEAPQQTDTPVSPSNSASVSNTPQTPIRETPPRTSVTPQSTPETQPFVSNGTRGVIENGQTDEPMSTENIAEINTTNEIPSTTGDAVRVERNSTPGIQNTPQRPSSDNEVLEDFENDFSSDDDNIEEPPQRRTA